MRSNLVYAAGLRIKNRFLLASTAMIAVRKLHVQATRTEDTINKVFVEVADVFFEAVIRNPHTADRIPKFQGKLLIILVVIAQETIA